MPRPVLSRRARGPGIGARSPFPRLRDGPTEPAAARALASHLERVARSAGETFAWTGEETPARGRSFGSIAVWLAAGVVACLALFAVF